jgi:ribosomal protein S18 acetylase RimI-like enzyme
MEIELKRLSTETLHDFLNYFDHRAFLNDEDWAGCYCQAYLHPPETPEEEVFGEGKARQVACDKVSDGSMDGYLAYSEGAVIGWMAAGSSLLFKALPDADDKVARILCFNIDPDRRQQGIANRLLDLVIEDLRQRGFAAVEAAPRDEPMSEKGFQGSIKMYEDRGFEKVVQFQEGHWIVRRHFY